MNPSIFIEFRMEGGDELVALPGCYDMPSRDGKDLGISHHPMNIGCTDESHRYMVSDPIYPSLGEEAAKAYRRG